MSDCIFCKIVSGELEASFVYQDEYCSAFLDIHPINPGHVLIVPNQHHERFTEIPDEVSAQMFIAAKKVIKALEKSDFKFDGENLLISDGEAAGQEVFHCHLHVIPRFYRDGQRSGFKHSHRIKREELDATADEIISHLGDLEE